MRAKRVDANQTEIVKALRKVGALVAITSSLGNGFPDIVVGFRGRVYMIEIKDGRAPPSAQKLTEPEREFHSLWAGYVHVINSIDQALQLLGATP
jgi:Holliday junction resolvase